MLESTYLMLKFFDIVKKIDGRKKLQKTVYLLECSGLDMPYKYEYKRYGPYSFQLQEEITLLVKHGLLEEKYDDSTYNYMITEEGLELKEILEKSAPSFVTIKEGLVKSMMKESSQFLEMASTYVFLIKLGYDREEAKKKALTLKPKLKSLGDSPFTFSDQYILN